VSVAIEGNLAYINREWSMASLIIIRTYSNSQLAHLDSAKLADEGIESRIHDDTMASLLPHLSNVMGGIKLLVEENDAPRAIEILKKSETISGDDTQTD